MMIGTALKELRLSRDITQTELADVLGRTQQSIAGWESNRINPDVSTLQRLAQYFGVTTDYLLGIDITDKSHPTFNEDELKLVEIYRQLEDEDKNAIKFMMSRLNRSTREITNSQHESKDYRSIVTQNSNNVSNFLHIDNGTTSPTV